MNAAFSSQNIAKLAPETTQRFRPGPRNTLVDALAAIPRSGLRGAVLEYIGGWPSAIQAAVQAAIYDNLTRQATVPITFAWTPAYDYSVTIYDVVDTDISRGGITILFTSRYPSDPHPLLAK